MDQLILVLVVGAVAFAKWLFENAGRFQGGGEPEDLPESPQNRPNPRPRNLRPMESDEEKMRRFMEALGLPPESAPPAPARKPAPRQPGPQRSPASKTLAPKPASAARPVRSQIAPPLESSEPIPAIPKAASVAESAAPMEVASIPQISLKGPETQKMRRASARAQRQTTGAAQDLRDQLRTPASLRNAILLREILGVPKGLQSTQSSTIFSPL